MNILLNFTQNNDFWFGMIDSFRQRVFNKRTNEKDLGVAMRLIFIRHAEPDYEMDSLTEKGFREAALLGERVKSWKSEVDELYVSCLGRARRTAEPVETALGKKAVVLDWLQEFRGVIDEKYGTYQGVPWDLPPSYWTGLEQIYQKDGWFLSEPMRPVAGKPTVQEVYHETCENLDALLKKHGYVREKGYYRFDEHNDDTIVLVCHMGITFCMISYLLGLPFTPLVQGMFIPPSGVTVLNTEEVEPHIASFRCQGIGDIRHLYTKGEPISAKGYFAEVFQK